MFVDRDSKRCLVGQRMFGRGLVLQKMLGRGLAIDVWLRLSAQSAALRYRLDARAFVKQVRK